jgi:ABC-type siderophore export system fused ATPase/permease subunit
MAEVKLKRARQKNMLKNEVSPTMGAVDQQLLIIHNYVCVHNSFTSITFFCRTVTVSKEKVLLTFGGSNSTITQIVTILHSLNNHFTVRQFAPHIRMSTQIQVVRRARHGTISVRDIYLPRHIVSPAVIPRNRTTSDPEQATDTI